jgi:hypothetical protein
MLNSIVCVIALAVVSGVSGSLQPQVPARVSSNGIVVVSGASGVATHSGYDGYVTYRVSDPYPGQATIKSIRSTLRQRGWRPRATEFVNDLPFDVTARWRSLEMEGVQVSVWYEQWEGPAGDVASYTFTYQPGTSPSLSPRGPMSVSAMLFGRDTVKELLKQR